MTQPSKNRKTAKAFSLSLLILQLTNAYQITDEELEEACLLILDHFNKQEME